MNLIYDFARNRPVKFMYEPDPDAILEFSAGNGRNGRVTPMWWTPRHPECAIGHGY